MSPRRLLLRLLVTIPLCGMLVAGAASVTWVALGSPRPASGATWMTVHKIDSSASFREAPTQPFFFLALGNDGRTDADPGLGDAVHVIGVNPATQQATILDVPRDTQAPDGDKITSWHGSRGLPGIVGQLNKMMGINIQYAVTANFPRFVAMIDAIGGVDIEVTEPMFDNDAATNFNPGQWHMNGLQLLAYSRDRKTYPAAGDRQRTVNQGKAILATLSTLRAKNFDAVGTMKLVATLAVHVKRYNLSLTETYQLGRFALGLDPANIRNVLVPTNSDPGGSTNLQLGADARSLFADFADDAILQSH